MAEAIADGYAHHWSPEQIVNENLAITVSPNTVYNWIRWGYISKVGYDKIKRYHKRSKRRKESLAERERKLMVNHTIEGRPAFIQNRERIGDWEVDCILPAREGKKVIVTFTERKTRYTFMALAAAQSGQALVPVFDTFMSIYENVTTSLTCDHGKEFANSTIVNLITKTYKKKLYFAHAYRPEERGSNENTNGLIRAYLPKGQTFEQLTQGDLLNIAEDLNTRPRKMHGWKSCKQVFDEERKNV